MLSSRGAKEAVEARGLVEMVSIALKSIVNTRRAATINQTESVACSEPIPSTTTGCREGRNGEIARPRRLTMSDSGERPG